MFCHVMYANYTEASGMYMLNIEAIFIWMDLQCYIRWCYYKKLLLALYCMHGHI